MRDLDTRETSIINKLLDHNVPGFRQLFGQLEGARVESVNLDETTLQFQLLPSTAGAEMPKLHYVPVEASAWDTDGSIVHVLLHVRAGKLFRLEYIREQLDEIKRLPTADDLFDFVVIGSNDTVEPK